LPPVRNLVAAEDPRVLDLAANNAADPYWEGFRPDDFRDDELDIPRAWRAKGYEPVADLISAWIGRPIGVGTVRGWWRLDLQRRRSQSLPPPDAIIKRKGGVLLPGWSDQTIREWLSNKERPFKTDKVDMASYLAWDGSHDEVDPAVLALVQNNHERGIHPDGMAQTARARPTDSGAQAFMVPLAYLTLGYEPMARYISTIQGRPVSENTICKTWRDELLREGGPWSQHMPMPDALIARGSRAELLPGWSGATIEAWLPTRPGSGNHTRGEERRGRGSQQWWAEREAAEVVTA